MITLYQADSFSYLIDYFVILLQIIYTHSVRFATSLINFEVPIFRFPCLILPIFYCAIFPAIQSLNLSIIFQAMQFTILLFSFNHLNHQSNFLISESMTPNYFTYHRSHLFTI